MRNFLTVCAFTAFAVLPAGAKVKSPVAPTPKPIVVMATTAPAGAYTLGKAHASLTFRISHMGFSHFTARFARFDVQLQFDPANPAMSRVEAKIDPSSLESDNPPVGFLEMLRGAAWLDAGKYPEMNFHTTSVKLTGPNSALITGDFSLHGVTRPMTLAATFNGGYAGHPMDPNARIGFSAHGTLKRSDFGITLGLPSPGSTFGLGDEIDIAIEVELSGPPLVAAPKMP